MVVVKEEVKQIISALEADVDKLKHEIKTLGVAHTVPAASKTCTVADYLLERLNQLSVSVRSNAQYEGLSLTRRR